MNEKDRVAEWVIGYREGFVAGYTAGMSDGRSIMFDNAKVRAYAALDAPDPKTALTEHFLKLEKDK